MMSPTKASKLLSDYAKNNFNAYKTLVDNGYSENTAKAKAKDTLTVAMRVVNEQLGLNESTPKEVAMKSYEILGLTREDIANRIRDIVMSSDNTNALKVLQYIAKDIGLNLTPDEEAPKAPSVNITVEKVNTDNSGYIDVSGE